MNSPLQNIVEGEVSALGYELVLFRRTGTRSRPVLELRIDRRDGERVSIADCVRVSRGVEARLDALGGDVPGVGRGRYELQVSSPGDARQKKDAGSGDANQSSTTVVSDDGSGELNRPTGGSHGDGSSDGRFD